jgi:hypothetical protein
LITPQAFSQFCSSVVPLIRYKKAIYTNTELFEASAEIANFGKTDLKNTTPEWKIADPDGKILSSGKLNTTDIAIGNCIPLGKIQFPLNAVTKATTLTITVTLPGTSFKNSWKIWVYPSGLTVSNGDVIVTQSLNDALSHLAKGKKVFLNPPLDSIKGIEGKFVPVFWSPVHFPDQPGSMGILCDPGHAALKHFPTENHSDWQWWYLCKNSRPILLDNLSTLKPVIRVVDNFYKNRRLGTVVEAKAGNGKLIICSIDLSDNSEKHPEARQLKFSILQYMNSADFNPETSVSESDLKKLILPEKAMTR